MLLYNFLWDGKHDKIKRFGACQAHKVGDLKKADVLVCVEDCWLERVLEDNGKLTKILQTMCSSIQNIKRCGGEYANAIMQKVNVFKQYKILCGERMLSTLDAFALCVQY